MIPVLLLVTILATVVFGALSYFYGSTLTGVLYFFLMLAGMFYVVILLANLAAKQFGSTIQNRVDITACAEIGCVQPRQPR